MDDTYSAVETAFSRTHHRRRKVFGSAVEDAEREPLQRTDFLTAEDIMQEETRIIGGIFEASDECLDTEDQHSDSKDLPKLSIGEQVVLTAMALEERNGFDGDNDSYEGDVCVQSVLESEGMQETSKTSHEHSPEATQKASRHTLNTFDDSCSDVYTDNRRRSKRIRKPTASFLSESNSIASKITNKPSAPVVQENLDEEALIGSIDGLFVFADKETVTVKDIVVALEAEYGVTLTHKNKVFVRSHLKNLVQGMVEPTVGLTDDERKSEEEHDDDVDTSDPELEDGEEDSYAEPENAKSKRTKEKARVKELSTREGKLPRRTAKPSAIRIHADMLRKKRMDELRVRQEELQVQQNKEDQERAEKIAARFDTNTEELKLKRLEDRLDLLQKLDKKRIEVVSGENVGVKLENIEKDVPSIAHTSDSDSDSDLELEIVDSVETDHLKPPVREMSAPSKNQDALLKVLSILPCASSVVTAATKKSEISWSEIGVNVQASPGKSLSARAMLRRTLLLKQRKMGNLWLARELGYNSEQDHLRDCLKAEELKRDRVIKMEETRLKMNERKQLRERMLIDNQEIVGDVDGNNDEDEEEDDWNENVSSASTHDEDEELALAKILEQRENPEHLEEGSCDGELQGVDDEESINDDVHSLGKDEDPSDVLISSINTNVKAQVIDEKSPMDPCEGHEAARHEEKLNLCNPSGPESTKLENETNGGSTQRESVGKHEPSSTEEVLTQSAASDANPSKLAEGSIETSLAGPHADMMEKKKAKNSGWKEMLKKEAEQLKKLKRRKGSGLVEIEADEEEEEEVVAGLEDFGFSLGRKKKDDDEEEDDELNDDDLKHVVDDLSEDEGDEEAGERARKALIKREEKEKHKEIMRRMREGYDGRRGGIAGGGSGARGLHRFDQLVAADNREDAKRLGLLNDDELESEDEDEEKSPIGKEVDEMDDEVALLDKMLKDRFLHRSSVEMEEHFSDDENDDIEAEVEGIGKEEDREELEQERLAKRFAKRARMQRLIEAHGEDEEFTQLRLIDEDQTMKEVLLSMKEVGGLTRRQVSVSSSSQSAFSGSGGDSQMGSTSNSQSLLATQATGGLILALKTSIKQRNKTSFLGGKVTNKETVSVIHKCVNLNHVVFGTENSQSRGSVQPGSSSCNKRKRVLQTSSSLWDKVALNSFRKKNN